MTFSVIDTATGEYPDLERIALKEDWAKGLMYCDMEGFAIEEDGTLLLLDECGRQAVCPEGRFEIVPYVVTNADRIRSMTDEELVEWLFTYIDCDECPAKDQSLGCFDPGGACHKNLFDWLKQEYKEDEGCR